MLLNTAAQGNRKKRMKSDDGKESFFAFLFIHSYDVFKQFFRVYDLMDRFSHTHSFCTIHGLLTDS